MAPSSPAKLAPAAARLSTLRDGGAFVGAGALQPPPMPLPMLPIAPLVIAPLVMPGIMKLPVLPVCGTKGGGIGVPCGAAGACVVGVAMGCCIDGRDCGGGW